MREAQNSSGMIVQYNKYSFKYQFLLLNVNSLCLVLRKRRAEAAKARKAKILAQVKFLIIWVSPLNVEASLFFLWVYTVFF